MGNCADSARFEINKHTVTVLGKSPTSVRKLAKEIRTLNDVTKEDQLSFYGYEYCIVMYIHGEFVPPKE